MFRKEFLAFPSQLKRGHSLQERREELQGRATIPRVPQMSQSTPGKRVFLALPRLSSRGMTHTTVARWTAIWESLVGKPRGKDSGESHRFLHPREGKRDTTATAREESARACPNSRRGLTPLGRLQKYPRNHVSTGVRHSLSGVKFPPILASSQTRCTVDLSLQSHLASFPTLSLCFIVYLHSSTILVILFIISLFFFFFGTEDKA